MLWEKKRKDAVQQKMLYWEFQQAEPFMIGNVHKLVMSRTQEVHFNAVLENARGALVFSIEMSASLGIAQLLDGELGALQHGYVSRRSLFVAHVQILTPQSANEQIPNGTQDHKQSARKAKQPAAERFYQIHKGPSTARRSYQTEQMRRGLAHPCKRWSSDCAT
jgi:hypothetical protein